MLVLNDNKTKDTTCYVIYSDRESTTQRILNKQVNCLNLILMPM